MKRHIVTVKLSKEGKVSTEKFLVEGVNFSDTETRVNKYLESLIKDGSIDSAFDVTAIQKKDYEDIYNDDFENYFEFKVETSSSDGEKSRLYVSIICASDFDDAKDKVEEIKDGNDKIVSIVFTKIKDAILFKD